MDLGRWWREWKEMGDRELRGVALTGEPELGAGGDRAPDRFPFFSSAVAERLLTRATQAQA